MALAVQPLALASDWAAHSPSRLMLGTCRHRLGDPESHNVDTRCCLTPTDSRRRYVQPVEAPRGLVIESERVTLRPFTLDDVPAVTAACQDNEIVKWTASIPSPYEESHARTWIAAHDTMRREERTFPFAVVDRGDRVLGCISVIRAGTPPGCGAIGYWMAAWARNRGVTTEALRVLSGWAFRSLRLDRLELVTLLGNVPSERVAEKAGFEMVEEMTDYVHPAKPDARFRAKRWVKASD